MPDKSLYEQLGGEKAVDVAVDNFYKKVLTDPRIKHFFVKTDMQKQREHQRLFLTVAFGGPNKYTGRGMRQAHATMEIADFHFDAVAQLLSQTLKELNVSKEQIAKVAEIVESQRKDIVTNKKPLFERIGGEGAINAAVEKFYAKLLADARVKEVFVGHDINKLKEHQRNFLTFAFGVPKKYSGRTLKEAHQPMKLTELHFTAVAENLAATLKELGVHESLVAEVMAIVGSTKDQIVYKGDGAPASPAAAKPAASPQAGKTAATPDTSKAAASPQASAKPAAASPQAKPAASPQAAAKSAAASPQASAKPAAASPQVKPSASPKK